MAGWLVKHWSVNDAELAGHYAVNADDQKAALRIVYEKLAPAADERLTCLRNLDAVEQSSLDSGTENVVAVSGLN
jgi:hypothetical protein